MLAWRAGGGAGRCGPCVESATGAGGEPGADRCGGTGGGVGKGASVGRGAGGLLGAAAEASGVLSVDDADDDAVFPVGLGDAGAVARRGVSAGGKNPVGAPGDGRGDGGLQDGDFQADEAVRKGGWRLRAED